MWRNKKKKASKINTSELKSDIFDNNVACQVVSAACSDQLVLSTNVWLPAFLAALRQERPAFYSEINNLATTVIPNLTDLSERVEVFRALCSHIQDIDQSQTLDVEFPASPPLMRMTTSQEAAAELGRKLDEEEQMKRLNKICPICLEQVSIEGMYTINCLSDHKFCFECLFHVVITALHDIPAHLPACPLANEEDGFHLLEENEVKQILTIGFESEFHIASAYETQNQENSWSFPKIMDKFSFRISHISDKSSHSHISGKSCQKEDLAYFLRLTNRLLIAKFHRELGHIRCVGCIGDDEHSVWFEIEDTKNKLEVRCPRCQTSFCCQCNATPYHFHCSCDEVMSYSRAWLEWNLTGRQEYLQRLAQENSAFLQLLTQYQHQMNEEIHQANKRFMELQQDEDYKSKHCKRCPKCNRTVEKLSGCDLMMCGQNYHGGDVQNGCGARFKWSEATWYVANAGIRKTPNELNVLPPQKAQQVKHEIMEGEPLLCDICHQPIVGPRIRCINCPIFNTCLQCNGHPTVFRPLPSARSSGSGEPERKNDGMNLGTINLEGLTVEDFESHICTILFEKEDPGVDFELHCQIIEHSPSAVGQHSEKLVNRGLLVRLKNALRKKPPGKNSEI